MTDMFDCALLQGHAHACSELQRMALFIASLVQPGVAVPCLGLGSLVRMWHHPCTSPVREPHSVASKHHMRSVLSFLGRWQLLAIPQKLLFERICDVHFPPFSRYRYNTGVRPWVYHPSLIMGQLDALRLRRR